MAVHIYRIRLVENATLDLFVELRDDMKSGRFIFIICTTILIDLPK